MDQGSRFFLSGGSVGPFSPTFPPLLLSFTLAYSWLCMRYFSTSISRTRTIPFVDFTICFSKRISCSCYRHRTHTHYSDSVLRFFGLPDIRNFYTSSCT